MVSCDIQHKTISPICHRLYLFFMVRCYANSRAIFWRVMIMSFWFFGESIFKAEFCDECHWFWNWCSHTCPSPPRIAKNLVCRILICDPQKLFDNAQWQQIQIIMNRNWRALKEILDSHLLKTRRRICQGTRIQHNILKEDDRSRQAINLQ